MAELYVGPHFWDRSSQLVSVRTSRYSSRQKWIDDMTQWAEQAGFQLEWSGESTHTSDALQWHQAEFYIADPGNRLAFALRWA